MVRISNKKRRRGTPKVTKAAKNNFFYKKPQFTNDTVKGQWNPRLSATQNMAKMGLQHKANSKGGGKGEGADAVEFFDVTEDSGDLDAMARNPRRNPMSEEDQLYVSRLMAKHGEDYYAMQMDLKTNPQQHPEKKLKRLCLFFKDLPEQWRVVDVPEPVSSSKGSKSKSRSSGSSSSKRKQKL